MKAAFRPSRARTNKSVLILHISHACKLFGDGMQINDLIILNKLSNLMHKCQSILYKISHMKILYKIYFIVASHVHGAQSIVSSLAYK